MSNVYTAASFVHNIEIAHRLFLQPGKCENIHGHSMRVTMTVAGVISTDGILGKEDFGNVKRTFRSYLDDNYDHRLLLNYADPFAQRIWTEDGSIDRNKDKPEFLPGLRICAGDPTTENLSVWLFRDLGELFTETELEVIGVHIQETPSNSVGSYYDSSFHYPGTFYPR